MTGHGGILTLNAGSSSLKFALFGTDEAAGARGDVAELGGAPHLIFRDATGKILAERRWKTSVSGAIEPILAAVLDAATTASGTDSLAAVGHRVVQGGADHIAPEVVTHKLLADLEAAMPLDPLHMPGILAAMRAVGGLNPALPQVACYDTAFHRTLPKVATRFALPRAITGKGIRRYGFHGLSYEYIAARLAREYPDLAKGRVLAAHLGSGASLCALEGGRSIETTTGFSGLEGLVMATRCGSLDPGVILHLAATGMEMPAIEDMLYRRSGLLGVSGISGDMRTILASDQPFAREAIDLFAYRIAIDAGAMVSALGGLDGLVFTAGIGQHAPEIRAMVCTRLAWLGLRLDEGANAANATVISSVESRVPILVLATDEEAMIAHHTRATLAHG